ncbi:uncharacterized protein L3040_003277 [Drepanopeziza brunnea f. sp. 'multigermtubi']|uniref:uncharacterized protein n=1 Tax=Drepanopeziza brunnea f. sp. 'multigermtubi' TaxID=698441 RepID=UPI00239906B2|nr:hypothetical protein L3040_003277 [Drepanopeziza brunnea f. sp. 'multigermtubi']
MASPDTKAAPVEELLRRDDDVADLLTDVDTPDEARVEVEMLETDGLVSGFELEDGLAEEICVLNAVLSFIPLEEELSLVSVEILELEDDLSEVELSFDPVEVILTDEVLVDIFELEELLTGVLDIWELLREEPRTEDELRIEDTEALELLGIVDVDTRELVALDRKLELDGSCDRLEDEEAVPVPFLIYTDRRFPAPQYSYWSPAHLIAQSESGANTDPIPKESEHQHSRPYSAPAVGNAVALEVADEVLDCRDVVDVPDEVDIRELVDDLVDETDVADDLLEEDEIVVGSVRLLTELLKDTRELLEEGVRVNAELDQVEDDRIDEELDRVDDTDDELVTAGAT